MVGNSVEVDKMVKESCGKTVRIKTMLKEMLIYLFITSKFSSYLFITRLTKIILKKWWKNR